MMRNCASENLEIPGSRFARPGMTEYNNQEQKTQGETTSCPPRWRRKGHSL
jgi:hypothetical protein